MVMKKDQVCIVCDNSNQQLLTKCLDGELVRQKPGILGYSGTQSDSAGPGEYNLSDTGQNGKQQPVSMFKSKSKREAFNAPKQTPGPGQYNIERAEQNVLLAHAKPAKSETSVFCSTSSRSTNWVNKKEQTPGPGEYGYESSFKTQQVPDRLQNFGSTSLRPFSIPSEITFAGSKSTPGPGAYNPAHSAPATALPVVRKPFSSTTDRFTDVQNPMPGPGSYDKQLVHASFTTELASKTKIGSYGVFGSTSRRFAIQKPRAPGPGQYTVPNKQTEVRRNDYRNANFASQVKRELTTAKVDKLAAPPVGTYEVKSEWVKKKPATNSLQETFVTRSPRFKSDDRNVYVPGPGQYDHDTFLATKKQKSFAFTESVLPKSNRFVGVGDSKEQVPGPGTYDSNLHGMNKRSYNITV
jgi:hypothetical protein